MDLPVPKSTIPRLGLRRSSSEDTSACGGVFSEAIRRAWKRQSFAWRSAEHGVHRRRVCSCRGVVDYSPGQSEKKVMTFRGKTMCFSAPPNTLCLGLFSRCKMLLSLMFEIFSCDSIPPGGLAPLDATLGLLDHRRKTAAALGVAAPDATRRGSGGSAPIRDWEVRRWRCFFSS